jgi:hypothetical protein
VYVHYNACMYVLCKSTCTSVYARQSSTMLGDELSNPFYPSSVCGVPRTCVLAYNRGISVYPGWLKQSRPSQKCDLTATVKEGEI